MANPSLDVLQALRIKGLATEPDLEDLLGSPPGSLAELLAELEREELIERAGDAEPYPRLLTAAGLDRHAELAETRRGEEGVAEIEILYAVFLELNQPVKQAVSTWQAGDQDAAGTEDAIEELDELAAQLTEAEAMADQGRWRFGAYADRFTAALARTRDGERRFIDDPTTASFHTVWFELHEDLLLTLGKSRSEEEGA
jgi:hypothetical protein